MMLVELKNLSKSYNKLNFVLKEINLTIDKAESIAIVGPSGSGKTTLLNILGTLDKPSSGIYLLNETDVAKLDENAIAKLRNTQIGFVFQMHHLLPQFTLIENVLLPVFANKHNLKDAEQRAHELIGRVGLTKQMYQYPSQMSGGECQRAAVVRALINKPQLLLADEPTGSLDASNAKLLGDLLLELNREQQVALVVVTHSFELAGRTNKVYHLNNGKLKIEN